MINTTPSIPTAVDQLADKFVTDYADKMGPIVAYVQDRYDCTPRELDDPQMIATLTVVTHAVEFGTFDVVFYHRRAITSAMDLADRRLRATIDGPRARNRAVYANLLGKLAGIYAATFADEEQDDTCHCGHPECGAC